MFDNPSAPVPLPPREGEPMEPGLQSAAVQRFLSCRWRHLPENGTARDYCTHRDVQPMAGTTGFDPQAWCPDCAFYKVRRTPRKRPADDYRY